MNLQNVKFDAAGLIPVVTQDLRTKEVLMLAYMNAEALKLTVETGKVHYYSRSRQSLWLKGETSGHFQYVKDIMLDCDGDTLLVLAEQTGAACHTGSRTCFFRGYASEETREPAYEPVPDDLNELYATITERRDNPREGSYTNYLFDKGIDKMLKKVGEESAEVIIAAKNHSKEEIVYEIADLMYHVSVVMANEGVEWKDIYDELIKRRS